MANDQGLLEVVKKHEDMWKNRDTIQLFFTKHYKSSVISRSLPNGYWEFGDGKTRSVTTTLDSFSSDKNGNPVATEMCVDFFCDGKDTYILTVPRDKYPLTEIRLCDYVALKDEGSYATIFSGGVSGGVDVRSRFLLPRYFSVHTEDTVLSLLELVDKYSAKIVSFQKNTSGDDIVEIRIECHADTHEHLSPWSGRVLINMSKGYDIEGYQFSTTTKESVVELITECAIKKHVKINEKHWIPCEWEVIRHNGDSTVGIRTSFIVSDYKINGTAESRLDNFRFPTNFVVGEYVTGKSGMIMHIWGPENKPARSFDTGKEYVEYYSKMCMTGEIQQENKHIALRISLVVLGLIMIVIALYRLYAKDR
jgi:hypothetical protein